jgi:hypothetical protein
VGKLFAPRLFGKIFRKQQTDVADMAGKKPHRVLTEVSVDPTVFMLASTGSLSPTDALCMLHPFFGHRRVCLFTRATRRWRSVLRMLWEM